MVAIRDALHVRPPAEEDLQVTNMRLYPYVYVYQ